MNIDRENRYHCFLESEIHDVHFLSSLCLGFRVHFLEIRLLQVLTNLTNANKDFVFYNSVAEGSCELS